MSAAEFSHRSLHGAREGRRRLLAATALVVIVVLLDAISGGKLRSGIRTIAADIWTGSAHLRSDIVDSGYFVSHRSLARENASLRDEVAQYEEKAAGYDVLLEENDRLRAMLHLAQNHQGITAPVVSSFRSSPYGTFLVGAGVGDGIAAGELVLTDGDFVIGFVADVKSKTTSVRGIFSAGETTDVLIGSTPVTVMGDGGGNGHASAPRGVNIATGTPIIAPKFAGRAVGVVGKVVSSPTSADQTVYVRLPVNPGALRYVYILHE